MTAFPPPPRTVPVPLSHGWINLFTTKPVSELDEMRERLERVHAEAHDLIAESQWLRLKSRELRDRIRRDRQMSSADDCAGCALASH